MHKQEIVRSIVGLVLAVFLGGCLPGKPAQPQPGATPGATGVTAASPTPAAASPIPTTATPTLAKPTATGAAQPTISPLNLNAGQLESLKSYRASLHVIANGTQKDQKFSWEYSIAQTVSSTPNLAVVTIQAKGLGKGKDLNGAVMILQGGKFLARWSPDGACRQEAPDLGAGMLDSLYTLLPDFAGASKDKSETIQGLPADHYLMGGNPNGVKGELWAASTGGFLIQATVTQSGVLPSLGPEANGDAQWEYRLSEINQPLTPEIPPECGYLVGGFPLPEDAASPAATRDSITFTTGKAIPDLAVFYREGMKKGWEASDPSAVANTELQLTFVRQSDRAMIYARRQGDATYVTILLVIGKSGG